MGHRCGLPRRNGIAAAFPLLMEHGMPSFSSSDVIEFLGHRVTAQGQVNGNFQGEITTDFKRRVEGVRIKHRVDQNSVKMYDKAHTVRVVSCGWK